MHYDVAGPVVLVPLAGLGALILFLGIPLIEALVYLPFRGGGFRRAFMDAWIANLITSLIGIALVLALQTNPTLLFFACAFVLSVLVEAAALIGLRHRPARSVWPAVIAANLATYALLMLTGVLQTVA